MPLENLMREFENRIQNLSGIIETATDPDGENYRPDAPVAAACCEERRALRIALAALYQQQQ